ESPLLACCAAAWLLAESWDRHCRTPLFTTHYSARRGHLGCLLRAGTATAALHSSQLTTALVEGTSPSGLCLCHGGQRVEAIDTAGAATSSFPAGSHQEQQQQQQQLNPLPRWEATSTRKAAVTTTRTRRIRGTKSRLRVRQRADCCCCRRPARRRR
ncbi:unnamed protein product, partial [Laminaria digitata]